MTTWVFEGTVLPTGDSRLTFGQDPSGEQLPGRYAVDVLERPAAVVLNNRRIR